MKLLTIRRIFLTFNKLHDYQVFASNFICQHQASAILLDCGCGKTVITLTAIKELLWDYFLIRKVLVVCPIRVAQVWKDETEKWEHLRGIKISLAIGNVNQRREALSAEADIYVINRENIPWLVDSVKWKWDMLVIDELSSFKNHKAKRFKALIHMRPFVKWIVGLTGTPTGNGLLDLWAEYRLLDFGKRLGKFIGTYRQEFFVPDKTNGMIVYSYKIVKGAEEEIYRRISDMTVSIRCTDVLKMPELISSSYDVRMSDDEMSVYKQLKADMVLDLKDGEITAANSASLSGKLSQLANGAIYSDDRRIIEVHNRKLDALEDIIEAQCGKPVLVAYWFRHDLDRIEKRLRELKVNFARIDTQRNIDNWNSKNISVGLIHPASAGHGLNLQQGGNTLIWFGLTWSLELYLQTNARLWRQGQQSETVIIQHIITKGTIDERILKALSRKEMTQSSLMDAVRQVMFDVVS